MIISVSIAACLEYLNDMQILLNIDNGSGEPCKAQGTHRDDEKS